MRLQMRHDKEVSNEFLSDDVKQTQESESKVIYISKNATQVDDREQLCC